MLKCKKPNEWNTTLQTRSTTKYLTAALSYTTLSITVSCGVLSLRAGRQPAMIDIFWKIVVAPIQESVMNHESSCRGHHCQCGGRVVWIFTAIIGVLLAVVPLNCLALRDGFLSKNCCFFYFALMKGGGLSNFFGTFSKVHFWSRGGVFFLKNANNHCLRFIHDPQSKHSTFF